MSLSEDLRNELAAITPRRECDVLAELSGLAHTAGTVHLLGGRRVSVHFDLASSAVARRGFSLLRRFEIESEIRTYTQHAFDRPTRYQLHVPEWIMRSRCCTRPVSSVATRSAGAAARACRRPELLPWRVPPRGDARRGIAERAAVAAPGDPLCLADGAEFLTDTVAREDVELALIDRGRHVAAYMKGADAIAGALALAGASDLALVFEEQAVVADTKSRANRLANADHANLVRTSRAAHEQITAVRALERGGRLERLSRPLQEIAELRVRHPSLSLRELALECDRPTSKAAVHRRLRKLVDLANS